MSKGHRMPASFHRASAYESESDSWRTCGADYNGLPKKRRYCNDEKSSRMQYGANAYERNIVNLEVSKLVDNEPRTNLLNVSHWAKSRSLVRR